MMTCDFGMTKAVGWRKERSLCRRPIRLFGFRCRGNGPAASDGNPVCCERHNQLPKDLRYRVLLSGAVVRKGFTPHFQLPWMFNKIVSRIDEFSTARTECGSAADR